MKKAAALVAILIVAGALFGQATDKFMSDYEKAEKLISQSNYQQAYDTYNGLIRDAQSRGFAAEMKYRTAQCAYYLGRFEVAISLLEKVLNEDIPADSRYAYLTPQVKFSLGLCYFQIGELQRAQRFLDEAQDMGGMGIADYLIRKDYKTAFDHLKDKAYPVDKLFLARSLINSRDPAFFSDIRSILTELSEDVSLAELVDFSRAEMSFFNMDYATSKNVFRDFMTKYPQTALRPFAEYYLACTYYHDREYRYAVDLLSKLTDPNRNGQVLAAHAYFMRGESYRELKLADSARFSFEQARIVAPNSMVDFYTTYRLYEINRKEGNLDIAKAEAQRLGRIALTNRGQGMMENLSSMVLGNIEFDQSNYTQALNYYNAVATNIPNPDAPPEELLIYEGAMTMALLSLNRQNLQASYNDASSKPKGYLSLFKQDSVAIQYGGDWRAYLLYNQADATYYSSYVRGEIRNNKRREDARLIYQTILEKYPDSYMSTLAKVTLAWYNMEARRFDDAIQGFDAIINSTLKTDALVLAAYGQGLAHYYKGDYMNAASWFFDESGYESQLNVTVRREKATDKIRYNEIADSLIDKALFWRGKCLEQLQAYGDALAVYEHIADSFPQRPSAGDASQKMIEFYIRAKQVDKAVAKTEEVKSKMTRNRAIYRDAYGYGLASLFDYYQGIGDETTAEVYAKRLTSELGTTEPIEQLYFRQAMRDTTTADIADLREKIEKIRARNPRSQYLPDPLFLLSYLLVQQKTYDEAKNVLVELNNWPNSEATKDKMPEITFQLATVYYMQNSYQDAITQLEAWTRYYEQGDNARLDLAPRVYYFLGLAYIGLAEAEQSPQVRAGYYRKAMSNLQVIKDKYKDSEFYTGKGIATNIDTYIEQCKRKIG